jgi:hypothetical protein
MSIVHSHNFKSKMSNEQYVENEHQTSGASSPRVLMYLLNNNKEMQRVIDDQKEALWKSEIDMKEAFWKSEIDKKEAFWKRIIEQKEASWEREIEQKEAFWKREIEKNVEVLKKFDHHGV